MTSQTLTTPPTSAATKQRLASLDQFRGYTVMGMLLVNYFGGYAVCPQIWKHTHDYCSYADTIMPQFLFAVGFSLRLTIGRKLQTQGQDASVYLRIVRRLLGLILVSLVVYNVGPRAENWAQLVERGWVGAFAEPLKRGWFQTLMHIAVTSLWILPVISARAPMRMMWMIGSALLHVFLSYQFNFVWCNTAPNAIDGGPLGFLTWCVPALLGTLACDWFVDGIAAGKSIGGTVAKALLVSVLFMGAGYLISCPTRLYDVPDDQVAAQKEVKLAPDPVWPGPERIAAKRALGAETSWWAEPPFVRLAPKKIDGVEYKEQALRKWNYWMMSQRGGTLSYPTFCAGFGLFLFILFYLVCDLGGWQWSVFRTFGTNALMAYVLHSMVSSAIQPFFPKDSPAWFAYSGVALFFLVNWVFLRGLEKQGVYLRA